MSNAIKLAIIAALEREVAPIVRGWEQKFIDIRGCKQRCWSSGTSVVVCSGVGQQRAREYTEVVIETFAPEVITSIGFAGAAVPDLMAGDVLVPAKVVSGHTGAEFRSWFGVGVLVTADAIAGRKYKAELQQVHGADAVDMEAAAVAEVCAARGRKFLAIKAMSDGWKDEMEFLAPYVRPEGFRTAAFLGHIAVRPALWGSVRKLKVQSQLASDGLCEAVRLLTTDVAEFERQFSARRPMAVAGIAGERAPAAKGTQ